MQGESSSGTSSEKAEQNAEIIRRLTLTHIAEHGHAPSARWLAEQTGLSEKTIKRHRSRLQLGTGKANPFQILTPHVIESLYRRAVGYSHPAVKIIAVPKGMGQGSEVKEVPYIEHYAPEPAAAKLFLQVVEGFTEKQQTEHSGSVNYSFEYHAPGSAGNPILPPDAED